MSDSNEIPFRPIYMNTMGEPIGAISAGSTVGRESYHFCNFCYPGAPFIFTRGDPNYVGYSKVLFKFVGQPGETDAHFTIPPISGDVHDVNITLLWGSIQTNFDLENTQWDYTGSTGLDWSFNSEQQLGCIGYDGTLQKIHSSVHLYNMNWYRYYYILQMPVDKALTWEFNWGITEEMRDEWINDGFIHYRPTSRGMYFYVRPLNYTGYQGSSTTIPSRFGAYQRGSGELNS